MIKKFYIYETYKIGTKPKSVTGKEAYKNNWRSHSKAETNKVEKK